MIVQRQQQRAAHNTALRAKQSSNDEAAADSSTASWSLSLTRLLEPTAPILEPAGEALDELTNGYALVYADLYPETPSTPLGQWFLASNVVYAAVGLALTINGDFVLGPLTEIVSGASFVYHYTQLDPQSNSRLVKLALMIDYILAFTSIGVALWYALTAVGGGLPIEGVASAGIGLGLFLLGCTTCATGTPYIVVHSLWHAASAYCAYVIGNFHLVATV